jgi:Mn-dependent DtxR family transcriptional regulator/Fe2+ transport system protein FeoA
MTMTRGVADLSAAEQAYLLAIRQSREGEPLSGADLARRMGVSPQATSEMLRRLMTAGFLSVGEGRHIKLTVSGNAAADGIFRRHALAEWLLTTVLGIGWAESDIEAMRLQACISPNVEAALDRLLGHPETCPHGNPIEEATAKRRPRGELLSAVASGARVTILRITEEAEEDAGLLSYLEARGLRPGSQVTVLARSESTDSLTLDGPLGQATLGLRPAGLIRVLPGEPDPALFHHVGPLKAQ